MYNNDCAVENWTDIVAIAVGSGYTIGLKSNGEIEYTGDNDEDKCENMRGWDNIMCCNWSAEKKNAFLNSQ